MGRNDGLIFIVVAIATIHFIIEISKIFPICN